MALRRPEHPGRDLPSFQTSQELGARAWEELGGLLRPAGLSGPSARALCGHLGIEWLEG